MAKINFIKDEKPAGPPVIPQVPPAVKLPPGTSGIMPLPSGSVIKLITPKHMLPEERKILEALDWVEGAPVPSNLAQIIQDVNNDIAAAEQQVAIDPNTPPLKFKPIPIGQLTPEKQALIKQRIKESIQAAQQDNQAQAQAARQPEVARKIATSEVVVVPDTPPERPAPAGNAVPDANYRPGQAVNPKSRPAVTATEDAPAGPETPVAYPAGPSLSHCPHCGWDLAVAAIAEPGDNEKRTFLASVLGQKVFTRDYPLMGGAVIITYRTLTTREIDAIYRQCQKEQQRGELTAVDYWEQANRYRLALQMLRIRTDDPSGFDHEMPEGLSPATNPGAPCHWELPDSAEPLPLIQNYLLVNILKTEVLNRVAFSQCGRFNQLVARLEALVDNSDFWQATRPPR